VRALLELSDQFAKKYNFPEIKEKQEMSQKTLLSLLAARNTKKLHEKESR